MEIIGVILTLIGQAANVANSGSAYANSHR